MEAEIGTNFASQIKSKNQGSPFLVKLGLFFMIISFLLFSFCNNYKPNNMKKDIIEFETVIIHE